MADRIVVELDTLRKLIGAANYGPLVVQKGGGCNGCGNCGAGCSQSGCQGCQACAPSTVASKLFRRLERIDPATIQDPSLRQRIETVIKTKVP